MISRNSPGRTRPGPGSDGAEFPDVRISEHLVEGPGGPALLCWT